MTSDELFEFVKDCTEEKRGGDGEVVRYARLTGKDLADALTTVAKFAAMEAEVKLNERALDQKDAAGPGQAFGNYN